MEFKHIGTTDMGVSAIGFGAMHLSINIERRPSEKDSIALLQRIVDELGVTFIDTADAYCNDDTEVGHNERLIAEALRGERRDRVIVATKGGTVRPGGNWIRNGRPEHLRKACEASLRALETDRIDLYQLHAPDPDVPIEDSIGAIAELQRQGKIRHIGVSNFSVSLIERAMREAEIVSVQNQYSVINRRASEEDVIAFCESHGLTYIPWNPVGGRGKAPHLGEESSQLEDVAERRNVAPHVVALAWLLQHSPAIVPIPGARTFEHIAEDVTAAEFVLSDEDMEELNSITP